MRVLVAALLLLAGCSSEPASEPTCTGPTVRCELDGEITGDVPTCGRLTYRVTIGMSCVPYAAPLEPPTCSDFVPTCAGGSAPACVEPPPPLDIDAGCDEMEAACERSLSGPVVAGVAVTCYFDADTMEIVRTECAGDACASLGL